MNAPSDRCTPAPRICVERIVHPESVAVIGASEDVGKFGGRVFQALVQHKFGGRLFPINPVRESVFGVRAYPSIAAAPEAVDLALIAVPVEKLYEEVAKCADAGVGACVIITARLEEFDAAGAALQADLVKLARTSGMRLIGPNCMGLISPHQSLALSSTVTLATLPELPRGGLALVSQSGALLGAAMVLARDHGVGYSGLISVGNQADLELCDFLEFFIEDPATTVVCLYVEGFREPSRFRALAQQAWERGKPIFVVKVGRSDAGQIAARSHTASLAGSFAAFAALCEGAGVLIHDDPETMVLVAGFFDKVSRLPAVSRGGVGLVSGSGGAGALLADRVALLGLPLADWGGATRARLAEHYLPGHIHNPIDLGSQKSGLGLAALSASIDAVADDPGVAVVVYVLTPQPLLMQTAEVLINAFQRSQKPFLIIIGTASHAPEVRARLNASGIPVVSRIDDGLRVLEAFYQWRRYRDRGWGLAHPVRRGLAARLELPEGALTEQEAKRLLQAYAIDTNRDVLVSDADGAVRAAEGIGYPVVLKASHRQVAHKSDLGLVQMNVGDASAVRQAFANIQEAGRHFAQAIAVVVAEQIDGGTELVLGSRFDPEYGAQVVVGFGGIYVELVKDFVTAVAPLDPDRALALLKRLRLFPLLDGLRGRPKADVEALVQALVAVSQLAFDLGPRLLELDVNPLIVRGQGRGVVAVDARAIVSSPAAPLRLGAAPA